jgi:hypothetical protein
VHHVVRMKNEVAPKKHSDEIRERREKVAALIKFKTEEAIAIDLDCSRETIARDVAFLKKTAQDWLDDLAKDGFIFEYKIALEEIKENRNKLKNLYNNATEDFDKRLIVKDSDANIALYIKLLSEAPTVLAFRRKTGGTGNV